MRATGQFIRVYIGPMPLAVALVTISFTRIAVDTVFAFTHFIFLLMGFQRCHNSYSHYYSEAALMEKKGGRNVLNSCSDWAQMFCFGVRSRKKRPAGLIDYQCPVAPEEASEFPAMRK